MKRGHQYLLSSGVLVLLFLPVLLTEYGKSDDISMLVNYQSGTESLFANTHFAWGRPLLGLYDILLFTWARTFYDLSWIRLLGVIGAALFATENYRFYSRFNDRLTSLAYAAAVTLTPAFVIFIGWATCSAHAWSALLGLLGGAMAYDALREKINWGELGTAGLVLLASECIYQPTASFFLFPLIIAASFSTDGRLWKRAAAVAGTFMATVLAYFILLKLSTRLFFSGTWLANRTETQLDLPAKIHFLWNETLGDILAGWGPVFLRERSYWIIIFAAALVIFSLVRLLVSRNGLQRSAVLAGAAIIGMMPLVAASENYTPPRALPFAYAVVFHLSVLGLFDAFSNVVALRRPLRLAAIFLAATVAAAAATLAIAIPMGMELNMVRSYVENRIKEKPRAPITVYQPNYIRVPGCSLPSFGQFSTTSTWNPWTAKATIQMILWENETVRRPETIPIITIDTGQGASKEWLLNLDLYEALGDMPRPVKRWHNESRFMVDTPFGPAERMKDGWLYSRWLGFFNSTESKGYQHPHLGRIRVVENLPTGQIVIDSEKAGTFVTHPNNFPKARRYPSEGPITFTLRKDGTFSISNGW